MSNLPVYAYKVTSLVGLKPNSFAYLKVPNENKFEIFVTDKDGVPYSLKDTIDPDAVYSVSNNDGSIVVTGLKDIVLKVSDTLQTLINSALQNGDNVSALLNDAGYLTLSDLPGAYSNIVYVNSNNPNTATIFDTVNPPVTNNNTLKADVTNLYIGLDSSTWTYNSSTSTYNTSIVPSGSNFFLSGTSIDAGTNKTSALKRNGTIETTGNKVTGGLSTQFQKGDGTLDSNSYALASQLHNPVTLGTANGLSLSIQQVSLGLSSASTNGALSSTDWNTFNNKQSALVSGTTIKTVGNQSLLGTGNVTEVQNSLSSSSILAPSVDSVNTGLGTKQVTLISGTNIKTIEGISLLGSGDINLIDNDLTASTIIAPSKSAVNTGLALKESLSNKNIANGYAGLDGTGKIFSSQLPALAITDTFVVASQSAMLALNLAETGDVAVRTDLNKSYILKGTSYSTLSDWQELLTPTSSVTSVFGRVGAITANTGDYTTALVTETTNKNYQTDNQRLFNDATSSIQTQLNSKQNTLISGTNIKTLGGQSLLGTGDVTEVQNSLVSSNVLAPSVDAVNNKFFTLTTTNVINGSTVSGTTTTNALDNLNIGKANDSSVIHTTGNESFTGVKSATNTSAPQNNGLNITNNAGAGSYSYFGTTSSVGNVYASNNTGAGTNYFGSSTSGGRIFHASSSGGGYGFYSDFSGSADGIVSEALGGTGFLYLGKNSGATTYSVDKLGNISAKNIKAVGTINTYDSGARDSRLSFDLDAFASPAILSSNFSGTASEPLLIQPFGGTVLISTPTDNGSGAVLQVSGTTSFSPGTLSTHGVTKAQLDLKATDANVIHTTGNETKAGNLTFSNSSGTPSAILLNNSSTAGGILSLTNAGNFNAFTGTNSGSGNLVSLNTSSTGAVFSANGQTGSTGLLYVGQNNGTITYSVDRLGTVTSTKYQVSALNTAPSSSTDTGTTGEIRYTSTYIYVCIATNTWVRSTLSTF